jgi:hypothetical protein
MSELDEAWAAALSEAEQKARVAGRNDLAAYLSLKNSNDLLRKAGVQWLIESFTTAAGEANRAGASVRIERAEGHRFRTGTSTMVGQLITLTYGVRTLFVEAGWPRVPRDGIVHGRGLAAANIRHMGIRTANEELVLTRTSSGAPDWKSLTRNRSHLHTTDVHRHISILLDRPY